VGGEFYVIIDAALVVAVGDGVAVAFGCADEAGVSRAERGIGLVNGEGGAGMAEGGCGAAFNLGGGHFGCLSFKPARLRKTSQVMALRMGGSRSSGYWTWNICSIIRTHVLVKRGEQSTMGISSLCVFLIVVDRFLLANSCKVIINGRQSAQLTGSTE
jgi:hypothetical protein